MMGLMAEPLFPSRANAVRANDVVARGRIEAELIRDFGAWMTSEQRRIYGLCHRMLQDPDEANSATQDIFFKAYQALKKEDAQAVDDPARWLTRIAVNTCLDRLRSRKWQFWRRRPQAADEAMILGLARSKAPEGEQRFYASEIGARLERALTRLSERQRAVFTLRHYDEMSLEEIGEALGLDVGTVKAHMFRAVGKLRKELRDLYEGGGE
jgi:RNA polymerase sigma-70 factor, ECF subfamily